VTRWDKCKTCGKLVEGQGSHGQFCGCPPELDLNAIGETLLKHAKAGCLAVLEGRAEVYKNPLLSAGHFHGVLTDLGVEYLDGEGDSNGWQHDFWEYYEHEGVRYCQSGSGHYGGGVFKKA
jgi:hypothetical protein